MMIKLNFLSEKSERIRRMSATCVYIQKKLRNDIIYKLSVISKKLEIMIRDIHLSKIFTKHAL